MLINELKIIHLRLNNGLLIIKILKIINFKIISGEFSDKIHYQSTIYIEIE